MDDERENYSDIESPVLGVVEYIDCISAEG